MDHVERKTPVPSPTLFFFKQKTAYEMVMSDWSSDVCSSDLAALGVAFTATFGLALALGAAIAAAAPLVARWPGVSSDVTAPVRWLALLVVLSSLRMPAMVLLERRLAYLPLTVAETADTVTFHAVAIAAAIAGAGLWSFVMGALAARVANLAVLWIPARWPPTVRWERAELA